MKFAMCNMQYYARWQNVAILSGKHADSANAIARFGAKWELGIWKYCKSEQSVFADGAADAAQYG